ncbi:DNA-binding response OmpR family regulator [Sphingomonas naasensis]|uniref:Response regulator n=1 Tax=Sphingomonas naasensis TaxID=1344951 RepID=A0A4S1WIR2_9SPHN|nr:response regulator [Sphingomonas naasensis]NIJ22141.1 DNA-binding response OmpR family regulator [Sphingomonas naasensis]TGX42195.1 response regulator [Sphingomonas naasensis]
MRTVLATGTCRTSLNEIAQRLGNLGYLVVLANSACQALELVSARGFDLVLIDALAPTSAATHLLAEIRGSRDTADLPVIMLGEGPDEEAAVAAFGAGVDDWLAKPIGFALLGARIERTLARATRIEELKRLNLALDARVAARAIELGEAQAELAATRADRIRLMGSIRHLHDELAVRRDAA